MYHCGLIERTEEYVKTFEQASDSSADSSSDDDGTIAKDLPKPPELLKLWKNARRARKWLKEQKDKRRGNSKLYDTLVKKSDRTSKFLARSSVVFEIIMDGNSKAFAQKF